MRARSLDPSLPLPRTRRRSRTGEHLRCRDSGCRPACSACPARAISRMSEASSLNGFASSITGDRRKRLRIFVGNEAQRHRLVVSQCQQRSTQLRRPSPPADSRRPRRRMRAACWGNCCSRAGARSLRSDQSRAQCRAASWECGRRIQVAHRARAPVQNPSRFRMRDDLMRFQLLTENAVHLRNAQHHRRLDQARGRRRRSHRHPVRRRRIR